MEQNIENIIVSIIAQYLMDDKEGMKKLVSFFLDRVMLEEAKMQVGAKAYERTGSRKAHRNGYRQRSLKTRYGTIELNKPQIREFPFETQVFDRYSRVERATRNAKLNRTFKAYLRGR